MESLNWAYRGSIAGFLMRTLPMWSFRLWHKLLMTPRGRLKRMVKTCSVPTTAPSRSRLGWGVAHAPNQSRDRDGAVVGVVSIFEEGSALCIQRQACRPVYPGSPPSRAHKKIQSDP